MHVLTADYPLEEKETWKKKKNNNLWRKSKLSAH